MTFGSVDVKDIFSARLRAGWTTGIFMPYAFVGASYGIADLGADRENRWCLDHVRSIRIGTPSTASMQAPALR